MIATAAGRAVSLASSRECDVSSRTIHADSEAVCPPAPEGFVACCHADDRCRFDSGRCAP